MLFACNYKRSMGLQFSTGAMIYIILLRKFSVFIQVSLNKIIYAVILAVFNDALLFGNPESENNATALYQYPCLSLLAHSRCIFDA